MGSKRRERMGEKRHRLALVWGPEWLIWPLVSYDYITADFEAEAKTWRPRPRLMSRPKFWHSRL